MPGKKRARKAPAQKSKKKRSMRVIDAGRAESRKDPLDPEVSREFSAAQRLGTGSRQLQRKLREHHSRTPRLSGGDIDAAWDRADVGDETVGGSIATPGQDVVDEIGDAVGLTYEDNEPLRPTEKVEKRDRRRWDLDPASSEDYQERQRRARPTRTKR
jgi:uncharacterized protein DUF6335